MKNPHHKKNKEARPREHLTEDEVMSLRKAAKSSRNPLRNDALILMMFRHALRVGEVSSLKWSQVDLDNGCINISRLKGSVSGSHPLRGDEIRLLRKLSKNKNKGPYVFMSETKTPLSTRAIHDIIAKAGKKALMPFSIHPHMLRHAAGYYLTNKGIETRTIMAYLGHKNIQSTVIYTNVSSKRYETLFD